MLCHTARMEVAQTFWERLEEASRDVGLPSGLSDIGRELDIWPSAVKKWRDGLGLPGEKNIIDLAMHRGVNVEWLKTGRGQKLAEGAMDQGTRELLKLWQGLPDEARARLLSAARYEGTVNPPPLTTPPNSPARRASDKPSFLRK